MTTRAIAGAALVAAGLLALAAVALAHSATAVRTRQVKLPANNGPPLARKSVSQGCPRKAPEVTFAGFSVSLSANFAQAETFPLEIGREASKGILQAVNVGSSPGKASIFVYCSKRTGRVTQVRKTATLHPHKGGSVSAKCPRGKNLLFGGYDAHTNSDFSKGTIPVGEYGINPQKWSVLAVDAGDSASKITAVAYCARVAPALQVAAPVNVKPGASNTVTAKCPSGTHAAYGGYVGEVDTDADPLVVASALKRSTRGSISARATNLGASTKGKLQVLVYCR